MGKTISFKRPDGQSVAGYLAEPANGAAAPGVVVIQEWWGLNDQIKGVADMLAAAGYRALVPDLYRGKVALEANEADLAEQAEPVEAEASAAEEQADAAAEAEGKED